MLCLPCVFSFADKACLSRKGALPNLRKSKSQQKSFSGFGVIHTMNKIDTSSPDWQAPIAEKLEQQPPGRCILVLMPEYRPDLVHAIANNFDLEFYDYRQDKMAPLGQAAGTLTLAELTDTLTKKTQKKGIVAFNVEALMATKSEGQRIEWLNSILEAPWSHTVLIPLVIFHQDAPGGHDRVSDLLSAVLPEQNLINRLAM